MLTSVLVGAGDAPTWRHHDVAQLWMAQLRRRSWPRAICPLRSLFGQFDKMDRYRGIGGGWGADLAMAMWVPLVGRLPLLFRIGRFDGRAMAWQATLIGPWCRSEP